MRWSPLLAIFSSLLISACATPPDVPLCVSLGSAKWGEFRSTFGKYCDRDVDCAIQRSKWDAYLDGLAPSDHGWCTMTISTKEYFLNGAAWSKQEVDAVRVPPDSWAKIKAYIIENCKQNNQCSKDIQSWTRKMNSF